jgi:hypothetical protein
MVRLSAQAYAFPRDSTAPREWEDSAACSVRSGRFAVADGAAQAYRSGEWAEVLTEAYITSFPPPERLTGPQRLKVIRDWFGEQVRLWSDREPVAAAWWVRDAAAEHPPSAAFAGFQLTPDGQTATCVPDQGRWHETIFPADLCRSV